MVVIVYHAEYGCDTGCCGHSIELQDDEGNTVKERFVFAHGEGIEWAKQLVLEEFGEEHVKDLDWENCVCLDNC